MALYDKMATTAARLLAKYGRTVQLRQQSTGSGDYDPATGTSTPEVLTTTDRKALALDQPGSQISQRFGNNNQANTLINQGEKWLYMDAKGVAPAMQDAVIIDAIEYRIIDVQVMGPGGVPVLYLIVVRC